MDTTEGAVPDEVLVERARDSARDDTRDFEQLVERHQYGVASNCRYLSGSDTVAKDLTQEVFVKAYFALDRFDGRARFRTWLNRIKVNHCLNFLRDRKKVSFTELSDAEAAGEPALAVDPASERRLHVLDERERTAQALDALSDTLRVPLLMRDLDGYSYQEIADSLGIGLSAAKMRIKRAREAFRDIYGERGE